MSDQTAAAKIAPSLLVVDDNAMARKLIQMPLEKDGFTVMAAACGEEALKLIESDPPALIFLDLLMDGLSGLDVLAALKADAHHRDIAVVIVSGTEDAEALDKCLAAGANDFLQKPVRAALLREVASDLVGAETASIDSAAMAVIDPGLLRQLINDLGLEKATAIVTRFQDQAPGRLDAIQVAANPFDADDLRPAVGGLKGGARTLGLTRLVGACREIERALRRNDLEAVKKLCRAVGDHLGAALSALDE